MDRRKFVFRLEVRAKLPFTVKTPIPLFFLNIPLYHRKDFLFLSRRHHSTRYAPSKLPGKSSTCVQRYVLQVPCVRVRLFWCVSRTLAVGVSYKPETTGAPGCQMWSRVTEGPRMMWCTLRLGFAALQRIHRRLRTTGPSSECLSW
jgi:hypothetical protein